MLKRDANARNEEHRAKRKLDQMRDVFGLQINAGHVGRSLPQMTFRIARGPDPLARAGRVRGRAIAPVVEVPPPSSGSRSAPR